MAYEAKTRALVTATGRDRELFSVLEGPDGYLQLFLKHPEELGKLNDGFDAIKMNKFSLHLSERSATGARTVKQTVMYRDGRSRTTAALWQPGSAGAAFLVYAYRCEAMNTDVHLARVRPTDTPVHVAAYDPCYATLAYALFAGDPGIFDQVAVEELPYEKHKLSFARFDIVLFVTFMNVPSLPRGAITVPATSSRTFGNEDPTMRIEGGSPSIRVEDIGTFLRQAQTDFRNGFMHQMVNWRLQQGERITDEECATIEERANLFSSKPLFA
jgi:hypothetical protein